MAALEVEVDDDVIRQACPAVHCDEDHDDLSRYVTVEDARDQLREALTALIEAHHRTHDERFAWSLCSHEVCRDTAVVFGLR